MNESVSKKTRSKPRTAGFFIAILMVLGLDSVSAQTQCTQDSDCDSNAACAPLSGGLTGLCECNSGYAGNGATCNPGSDYCVGGLCSGFGFGTGGVGIGTGGVGIGVGSNVTAVPANTTFGNIFGNACTCNGIGPRCASGCGGGGDPHFKTWTGDKYDFHGACDLVLLQNPEFNAGLGMHVHIRTKAWGRYSSIETAAVRIGEDTLEVQADGDKAHHWINGVADAELPSALSGFPIEYTEINKGKKKQRFYTITLDGDEKIVVNTVKKLVQVMFKNAAKDSFVSSVGLMGDFETGARLDRDGKTVIKKWDPFGQEWQVTSSEPSLFRLVDGPQHPDKCVMPLVTSKATKQRRLSESAVGEAEAAKACARVSLDDRDECIFDVLATGDIEMVDIYDTATAGVH